MSVGPTAGIVGSAAGAPAAQRKGGSAERSQQDAAAQARKADSQRTAEKASGIGETEQDHQSGDRDADGRRIWEIDQDADKQQPQDEKQSGEAPRPANDPSGERGAGLDLTG